MRTATELPACQSERQLMLDRQSASSCRQLSQAQSPLTTLVGGEPSFSAGHRLLRVQARKLDRGSPSGKEAALRRLPPLRTGRVPLKTSGSSTSRTTRLLFLILLGSLSKCAFICQQFTVVVLLAIAHGSFGLGMDLLMTEEMNQCQVAVAIFASPGSGQKMMKLKFLVIEE